MQKISDFIRNKQWKQWKKDQWLILFLAGILLLVIAVPTDCGSSGDASSSGGVFSFGLNNSSSKDDKNTKTSSKSDDNGNSSLIDDEITAYESQMEERLASALAQMDGVGKVQVMITFQDAGESVVEKDSVYSEESATEQAQDGSVTENSRMESSESTVYDADSDDGTPFIRKTNAPAIEGVLVVAEGGGQKSVAADISEAVEALFGVEPHKIKVVEMNQNEEEAD